MQVQLRYRASSKLQRDYLAHTGNELPWPPYITVELNALTPAQQAIITQAGIGFKGQVDMPLPVFGIQEGPLGDPDLLFGESVGFDAVPSVEEWLDVAATNLATHARWQPELDAIQREVEEAKRRAQAEAARQRAVARECIAEIDALKAAGDLAGLQAYRAHYDRGLTNQDSLVQGSAFNQVARALGRAIGELEQQHYAAEKAAWVDAHGSERLRRACGHGCERLYVIERAAQEAPGFIVDFNEAAEWEPCASPTAAALAAADAARHLDIGPPDIVRLTAAPSAEEEDGEVDTGSDGDTNGEIDAMPSFDPVEAVIIRGYLNRYDLVKTIG